MRIAGAAVLFAATLVAPARQAAAQNPPPAAGVPTNCWVDMPNGGAMVIPNAVTVNQCEAAALRCLGLQPHGIVHHSTAPHVVASNLLAECDATGQ